MTSLNSDEAAAPSWLELPSKNLVLTGFLGVGKSTIARQIRRRLNVELLDIDEEIELRELMSIAKLRELYGDSRLRKLEYEICRQASLMRRSVIVVPGAALSDSRNYRALSDIGMIVCVTCELGEALRRLHLKSEQQFRDESIRRRMMSRIRREYGIINDTRILQLDTTHLTIDEEVHLLTDYWLNQNAPTEHFRQGPPERIKPPQKATVGLSVRRVEVLRDDQN
ncbi:MAG: hypothetical protein GYB68_11650 [Chloroflexi bacterium]|nr:hypothetical protein [Chloroflexota bacterium]